MFVPAVVSGALTAEKERNTLQLLFLTKLGPWTILLEKLFSRLVPVATFLLVSLPLLFIAYLWGGLTQSDVGLAIAELALTVFELASIALFCSAFSRDVGLGLHPVVRDHGPRLPVSLPGRLDTSPRQLVVPSGGSGRSHFGLLANAPEHRDTVLNRS